MNINGFFRKKTNQSNQPSNSRSLPNWEMIFPGINQEQIDLARKLTYYCIDYADKLVSQKVFSGSNLFVLYQSAAYAKLFCYHMITRDQSVHSLFYAYYELYLNNTTDNDPGLVADIIHRMHTLEKMYKDAYFGYSDYSQTLGDIEACIRLFTGNVRGELSTSEERFKREAGLLTVELHRLMRC